MHTATAAFVCSTTQLYFFLPSKFRNSVFSVAVVVNNTVKNWYIRFAVCIHNTQRSASFSTQNKRHKICFLWSEKKLKRKRERENYFYYFFFLFFVVYDSPVMISTKKWIIHCFLFIYSLLIFYTANADFLTFFPTCFGMKFFVLFGLYANIKSYLRFFFLLENKRVIAYRIRWVNCTVEINHLLQRQPIR